MMKIRNADFTRRIVSILMIASALSLIEGRLDTITPWIILGSATTLSIIGCIHNKTPSQTLSCSDRAWVLSSLLLAWPINNCTCSGSKFALATVLICVVLGGVNLLEVFLKPDGRSLEGVIRAIFTFLVILDFSFFWTCRSNVLLDTTKPQQFMAAITELRLTSGAMGPECDTEVQFTDEDGAQKTVHVLIPSRDYKVLQAGDAVVLSIGQGFWESPYYELSMP